MPIGVPQSVMMAGSYVNVPTDNGLFVTVMITTDGQAPMHLVSEAVQSLTDLLQEWPGRHPQGDVTGQFYDTTLSAVTPTNPLPPPPPPGDGDEDEAPE